METQTILPRQITKIPKDSVRNRASRLIALLLVHEGTARELTIRLNWGGEYSDGARSNTRKWLESLHDVGVVYIKGLRAHRNQTTPIYAIQPSLFHFEDSKEIIYGTDAS